MSMQQTPRKRRSPWVRYAPIIAVLVIVVVVAIALATRSSGNKNNNSANAASNNAAPTASKSGTNGVPLFYTDAKAQGVAAQHQWHNCDTTTGRVAIPVLNPPPCVEESSGSNGGATSPGVTANTIRIGYYIAKPDPVGDALLKAAGAYDSPDDTAKAAQNYAAIYQGIYQTWGRKVQLVRINGTGASSDAVAARNDADTAASDNVFAVVGGPSQAKQFGDELAAKHILCVGTCIIAQPQKYIEQKSPYMWSVSPSPEQTSSMFAEFLKNQLVGKPAQYGGPDVNGKQRTFTLLTYDTPDGQFKSSWDDLATKVKATGANIVSHVDYYLNLPTLQTDARTIATKLKQAGATTIIFTGDPLFPKYLTSEMTKENYFPEWAMSGTVLADTAVFGRTFDQQQWKHAFGLDLTPVRIPKDKEDAYTLHQWWYGTQPPTQNNYQIVKGDWELLFDGLQAAGPNLTPQSFQNGMFAIPTSAPTNRPTQRTIATYGSHGYWPGVDPLGLDNAGILYWDPTAAGQDETGTQGVGMYRLLDGGVRYLPNHWPTTPVKLFDPAGTVTVYGETNVPADLLPKTQPVPANAPAHK